MTVESLHLITVENATNPDLPCGFSFLSFYGPCCA